MTVGEEGPISIVGAGAWGTALAWSLATNGKSVTLWAREEEVVEAVNEKGENSLFLPGARLPEGVLATGDIAEAARAWLILLVVPSQFMRGVLETMAGAVADDAVVVSCAKGIENETLALPAQVISETLPEAVARRACYLSGPTFARELVKAAPTAATIASKDAAAARLAQSVLSAPYFRLYVHDDVTGVELGGALKNVIAIASGISDGLGFGHNTRAALVTRGLSEMTRLGEAMGANPKTFAGLSGIGDLVLTCTGDLSRNRTVGLRLGRGERIGDILGSMSAVAEGVATSLSGLRLAEKHGVQMPITRQVYSVLSEGKAPKEAVAELMGRELKTEFY